MSDPRVRTDWYTAARFAPDRRDAIAVLVPAGHRLSVTHGGRRYTASLFAPDGECIQRDEALTPERACERVLAHAATAS